MPASLAILSALSGLFCFSVDGSVYFSILMLILKGFSIELAKLYILDHFSESGPVSKKWNRIRGNIGNNFAELVEALSNAFGVICTF